MMNMSGRQIEETLRAIRIFRDCDEETMGKIAAGANVQTYEKGKILFVQQDPAERYYVILSGWVKLFRETMEGAQVVVDMLPAGKLFGEMAVFNEDSCPYSAEIIEKAEIVSFPLAPLKAEIRKNGALTLNMLHHMAQHHIRQGKEIEHLSFQTAPQRIGCFLLRLFDQEQTGPVTVRLPYDKTLIAAKLGMQPETFSRALKKLRTATQIEIRGSTVRIHDTRKLSRFSCLTCSSGFPCKDLKSCPDVPRSAGTG